MKGVFVTFVFLAYAVSIGGQLTDGKSVCQTLITCYQSLVKQMAKCQELNTNVVELQGEPKNPGALQNCYKEVSDLEIDLNELILDQRREIFTCLEERLNETLPIENKVKQEQCADSLKKYQEPATTESPLETGNNSNPSTNNSNPLNQKLIEWRQCRVTENVISQSCSLLTPCCSEQYVCELKFGTSNSSTELYQARLDSELKRRECAKLRPPPESSVSPVPSSEVITVPTPATEGSTVAFSEAMVSTIAVIASELTSIASTFNREGSSTAKSKSSMMQTVSL